MNRKLKKSLASLAAAALLFSVAGCGGDSGSSSSSNAVTHTRSGANFSNTYQSSDTWVVYWYLCGTDLESQNGAASLDLQELQKVKLPPNVKVVIQTGGANQWHTNGVPTNGTGRFVYDSDGLHSLGPMPDANMGTGGGLADFLRFGKDNYPADHRVFVFWNHGGGSVGGICLDERYNSMMSLDEVRSAFSSVYGANPENPPFELIGFDACLMATVDTLSSIHGFARYMVASQENEPGCGWNYTGWVGALAQNPAMGGAALGKTICDTYLSGCKEYDVDEIATLSVADVSKTPALLSAYGAYGVEALQAASQNPRQLFSQLSRGAEASENYGGNTREQGYFDMVDMGELVKNTQSAMPTTSGPLLSALDDCVLYRVNGSYRPNGLGLSCYHAYDGNADVWRAYANLEVSPTPIKCLYYYLIFGQMPDAAQQYLTGAPAYTPETPAAGPAPITPPTTGPAPAPSPAPSGGGSISEALIGSAPATVPAAGAHPIYNVQQLENTPVDIDSEGSAFIQLSPSVLDMLSAVHCQLIYMDAKQDILLCLGSDSNIIADWNTGHFKDNFFGTWPMLEGHPVYVEIAYEGDGFNLYSIPIKLNGVPCNLQVVYDFKTEKYRILGARKDDNAGVASLMSSRELIKLKAGDTITTLHYGMTLSGPDSNLTEVEVDTFTIGDNPTVKDENVGDGTYGYFFEFVDPLNNSSLSNMVTYTIQNGQITTSVDNSMTGATGAQGGFAETGYGADPNLLQTNTGGPNNGGIAGSMVGGGSNENTVPVGAAPSGGGSIADRMVK